MTKAAKHTRFSVFMFLLLSISGGMLLSGCSGSNPNDSGTVSDYDPEFQSAKGARGKKVKGEKIPDEGAEESLLEKAMDAYDRGLYSLAKQNFNELLDSYPSSYYASFAQLKAADCSFYSSDYPAAVTAYQEFLKAHPRSDSSQYAKFQLGNSYRLQYRGVKRDQTPLLNAIKEYEQLASEYPQGSYSSQARSFVKESRESLAEHEALVADFYIRQGQSAAGENRFRELARTYGDSSSAADARQRAAAIPEAAQDIRGESSDPQRPAARGLAPGSGRQRRQPAMVDGSPEQGASAEGRAGTAEKHEDQAAADSALTSSLTCSRAGDFPMFTAVFSRPVRIASRKSEGGDKKVENILLASVGDDLSGLQPSLLERLGEARQCMIAGAKIALQELQQTGKPRIALLKIWMSGSKKLELMSLDRPNRVVGIIDDARAVQKPAYQQSSSSPQRQ